MSLKFAAVAPIALLTSACFPPETGVEAPYSAALQLPEDIVLAWNQAYNDTDDGIGALVMLDLLVYDSDSGYPMDNIRVEVMSLWNGVYLIPQAAIKTVPYPNQPADGECDTNGDGQIDQDAPDACSWWWDVNGDQYFEIASEYASAYSPNLMYAKTDEHGLLRVFVYVDSMPTSSSSESGTISFDETGVWASIGHESGRVVIATDAN